MSNGDPTKWEYFETMNVTPFLQQVQFYSDKQQDLKEQREAMRKK